MLRLTNIHIQPNQHQFVLPNNAFELKIETTVPKTKKISIIAKQEQPQ